MSDIDQTIQKLCQDNTPSGPSLAARYWLILGLAIPLVVAVTWTVMMLSGDGIRPNYTARILDPQVAAKQLVPLLLVISTIPGILSLMRPEARIGKQWFVIVTALSILPIMMIWKLVSLAPSAWPDEIFGPQIVQVLIAIPLISIVIVAGQIIVLRRAAVIQSRTIGALAGVAAGGIAAFIYALICTGDSPAYYGLWYSVTILISGAIGAIAGHRFLRW
ncbi:MAG: DUF1109 domain-containing protein [Rhodospirillaceae bacterium]